MDFGAPVVKDIPPQNGLQTLSQIMGLRQQQQNIALQGQQLAVGQSNVQQAQEEMRERMLLQSALQSGKTPDGQSLTGQDGKIDPEKFAPFAMTQAPLLGPQFAQHIIHTLNMKVNLNESIQKLTEQNRNDVSGIIRSAIASNTPISQVASELAGYAKQNPSSAQAVAQATGLLGQLPETHTPGQRSDALTHLAMAFQLPGATAAQQQPNMARVVDAQGNVKIVNENPYAAPPVGSQVGQTVATGVAPTIATSTSGIPVVMKGTGAVPSAGSGPGPEPTTGDWANFTAQARALNHRVQTATDLIPRIQEAEGALAQIHGGAGATGYEKLARILQAADAPTALVDKVGNGNLGAAQEAQKYLFQITFAGLKQSMQGDPSRVAEFNEAEKLFPKINTDPRAAAALLNFMEDQGKRDYAEQQWLNKARTSGTFNPATWEADYQKSLREGQVPGVPKNQNPGGKVMPTGPKLEAYANKYFGGDMARTVEFLKAHGY